MVWRYNGDKITADDIMASTAGHCVYCGRLIDARFTDRPKSDWLLAGKGQEAVIDHAHSRHRGGEDEPHNLMPACRLCNAQKSVMSIGEFELSIGLRRHEIDYTHAWFKPPDVHRDWLCVYSRDREKALLRHNYPR